MPQPAINRYPFWRYWLALPALLLLWPAVLNGMPFLFYDTPGYLGGANALASWLWGSPRDWTAAPVMLGRSIYYGGFLYASFASGSFWPAAIVQALVAGGCVAMFLRYFVPPLDRRATILVMAGSTILLAMTPLPFFISFMMPDLFTGLAMLSAIALILFWDRESLGARAFWIGVAALASLFHPTNAPILVALAGLGILAHLLMRMPLPWRAAAGLFAAATVGLVGEAAFSYGVEKAYGTPPIRPPFLTARLTADGPGTEFLKETCPKNGFLLCKHVAKLPLPSDYFLWSGSMVDGVFRAVPPAQRRQLSSDESRFALQTFLHLPGETVFALTRSMWRQFTKVGLGEFNYERNERSFFVRRLPPEVHEDVTETLAFTYDMPTVFFGELAEALAVIAAGASLWMIVRPGLPTRLRMALAMVLLGVLLNAAICGGLSTPHDRYQGRVLWLLPWIAFLAAVARSRLSQSDAQPVGSEA